MSNPNKQVECPECPKKFKRVCDMTCHHDNAHPNAKIEFVPEGEPTKNMSRFLGNLKLWPGRTAIIKSNSNGTAVITVMMGQEHIGSRPRDPNVVKPKVTFIKKKHRCPLQCKKSGLFATPSDVRRHLREKHPDYDGPVPVARVHPPQPNRCNHCDMSYSKRSKLNRHMLRDHGIATQEGEDVTMSDEDSPPDAATASSHTAGSAPSCFSGSQPQPSGAPVPRSLPPSTYAAMQPAVSSTCRNCGQRGHYARDCQKSSRMQGSRPTMGSGNSSLTCRNCMQDGHLAKNCPLPRQQLDMVRQAEDGARKLEELYARVVETQRNLTFMQQQAQMGIPPSIPGSMMGNMPGNLPGNLPVNMGGNMPAASYGMGSAFSGVPQGQPYGMGMNMGMQYGSVPQQSPGDWQGQGQGKKYPQQQQQRQLVYIKRQ